MWILQEKYELRETRKRGSKMLKSLDWRIEMERVAQVDLTAGERDRVERDLRWNLDKK